MSKIIERPFSGIAAKIVFFNFDEQKDRELIGTLCAICIETPVAEGMPPFQGPPCSEVIARSVQYFIDNGIMDILVNSQPGVTSFYRLGVSS